jgi:hypothetical protein
MIPEKRKQAMFFFLAIYAIFGVLIVYLFLFNQGIEITEDYNPELETKEVFVENTTGREINGVKIGFYDEEKMLLKETEIGTLQPKEKRPIDFSGMDLNTVTIVAEAPFHMAFERKIVMQRTGLVRVNFAFPSDILFGRKFEFAIELCNDTKREIQYSIEEEHSTEFFSEPAKRNTITIPEANCREIKYSLTPIQKGETTIYFKVNYANSSETFQQKIRVD